MNKYIKNSRGLTLVETLATVVVLSIILIAGTYILITSLNHYNKISAENTLRDEADVIMAQFHRELYPVKESEIQSLQVVQPISVGTNTIYSDSYLVFKSNKEMGFKNQQILIKDIPYQLNSNTKLITATDNQTNYSQITKNGTNSYVIKLVLKNTQKNIIRTFENEISTINDIKTGGN